jgi:uncharacterized OB-fold protein
VRCPRCGAPGAPVELAGRGHVVASTWVTASLGLDDFGADGYGVAWIDLDDGPRVQALVAGAAPDPDVHGTVDIVEVGALAAPVFIPEPS